MSEHADKLRTTLDQLHEELEVVETADPEIQQLLKSAASDIRSVLDESESTPEGSSTIVERLSKAARHYEERQTQRMDMVWDWARNGNSTLEWPIGCAQLSCS